jgi:hypothetical protein
MQMKSEVTFSPEEVIEHNRILQQKAMQQHAEMVAEAMQKNGQVPR